MTSQSFINASLRLFNSVLSREDSSDVNFESIKEYGVLVAPEAMYALKQIRAFLKAEKVSGKQINQTFYSCPQEVESKSFGERLYDQILHYFSTYGMESLGIHTEFMYVPNDWEKINVPEQLKFRVITGVASEVLVNACLELLKSGVALKQDTIQDILTVLDGCSYEFSGQEDIRNKEALVMICDRKGILPSDPDSLFRFLVYKATGKTLLIKDKITLQEISYSGYALPKLNPEQISALAQSFNRRKEYWMALKAANRNENRQIVNAISRASKSGHVPLQLDLLSNLTNSPFTGDQLAKEIEKANIFKLVKAANALSSYSEKQSHRFYAIRNGRSYVKPSGKTYADDSTLAALKEAIASRINTDVKVFIPEGVQYAIPTSEKAFTGNVPMFSSVEVDCSDKDVLVGIYWEGDVDYDLSCDSIRGERVGWNDRWNNRELVFSGDITRAHNGAAEWFVVKNLSSSWQILNNLYHGGYGLENPEFKIMVGYGNKESDNYCNYFINLNDLLFTATVKPTKRQTLLGVLSPSGENKIRFTLINTGNGNKIVSNGSQAVSFLGALIPRAEHTLKLNDFVTLCESVEEADVDLSPDALTKDSLLSLLR